MANNSISMPGGFGGLTKFSEEYDSKLKMNPSYVVVLIILIILFVLALNIFFPI